MTAPVTRVSRVTVDEWGVDFLITPRAEWLPDFLAPLIPERDYNAAVAKRCFKCGSIVVGEAAPEYDVVVVAIVEGTVMR